MSAVTIPAEIGGLTYKLIFKFGTIRIAEKELPATLAETFRADAAGLTLDALSAVFWAVLQPHHAMTREGSDNLIDEAGIAQVSKWISEGVGQYFGAGETEAAALAEAAGDEGNGGAKPKKGKPRAS